MQNAHALKVETVLKQLNTTEKGLTTQAVEEHRAQYGYNELPEQEQVSRLMLFFRQFHSCNLK